MRILINALFLIPSRVGGSETYLRGLVDGLGQLDTDNEYVLCLGREAARTFRIPNERWRIVASAAPSRNRPLRLALEQTWLPRLARAFRIDLIHSAGYTAPLVSWQRRVTSIHDMNYKRHPEDMSTVERLVYALLIPPVARRSDRVAALTQAARRDIVRWTGARPERVAVLSPGVRATWPGDPSEDTARLAAAGVSGQYVLSVATAYPHKNLQRLVQAFPIQSAGAARVRLVIVGLNGRATPAVAEAAERIPDVVQVMGWVDDELLASLYRGALCLAFPSLYEGFGLPILEAMSLGTPVVTSLGGATEEVAGSAAELVDPRAVAAIRRGLERVAQDRDYRDELRRRGLRRAADFSWRRTARAALDIYADARRP